MRRAVLMFGAFRLIARIDDWEGLKSRVGDAHRAGLHNVKLAGREAG